MVSFAGYDWTIKSSDEAMVGPGPNFFSANGVRVDDAGLHLSVERRGGRVYCAEVVLTQSLGRGTYRFDVAAIAGQLDRNLVLGMFTWSDAPEHSHREIDLEISRWGQAEKNANDMQFVVQPYANSSNVIRFRLPSIPIATTHAFTWMEDSVVFETAAAGKTIKRSAMRRRIPPGGETPRINLWKFGRDLAGDGVTEVVITKFVFTPETKRD